MCGKVENVIHAILGEVAMDHASECHQLIGWIAGTGEDGRWSCLGSHLNLHHVGYIVFPDDHEGLWAT